MGAITVRRLNDEIISAIKVRAKEAGRSMEEEARVMLTEAATSPRRLTGQAAVDYINRRRQENFGGRMIGINTTELIREMRDEDPTKSPSDVGYP